MDDDYGSDWINCARRNCIYWAHLYCLGFEVKDEDMDTFTRVTKYYCPTHNPHTHCLDQNLWQQKNYNTTKLLKCVKVYRVITTLNINS